ncbi:hypothetical protein [Desulfosporosinus sp. SB140]|uniref:hypothetical protein n=1 Tax=Desulfosporosinus paludis TaxID=3115649 RepID=UPI00388EBA49
MSNTTTPLPCGEALPLSSSCGPVTSQGDCPKEPLNFGISIFTPVSSVPGSSSLFFLQPLFTGKVFASLGILSVAQLFLFFISRILDVQSPTLSPGTVISPDQTVRMSVSDLQDFLTSVSSNYVQPTTDQPGVTSGTLETPEAPLVVALTVWGDFADVPYGPTVFLLFPVFTFPGVRGALPMLILEILATIFVRAVVPPQTTGSKPLTDPVSGGPNILQFTPENLLNLLNRFSKHF